MIIEKNTVVSVSYELSSKKGNEGPEQAVEKTDASHPFVFLFGAGGLLEDFESNLGGKKAGDSFDFHIEASKGYGNYDISHIVTIPKAAFHNDQGQFDSENVKTGKVLPMVDNHGNHLSGKVLEVTLTDVRMDFNHPLAGHDLHFKGKVLEVRKATADEISHGHVHGPGGHHH